MAEKLRFRFILISILSLVAVLAGIMLVVNVTNYVAVRKDADTLLDALYQENGDFFAEAAPPEMDGDNYLPAPPPNVDWAERKDFTAETPYETRYFTVRFDEDGDARANTNRIAAVDEDEAVSMAQAVLTKGKQRGYLLYYRYLVAEDGSMVMFVNCNRQLDAAEDVLQTSLIVSAVAILGMLILVLLFSRRAVKPIVEAYERQRQFVTEASHELKTPITIISANNELLQLEYGDNESTDAIEHQVKRLSSMVKSMVSLSRLDEAEHIEKGTCNLGECVEEHVELARNALTAGDRKLDVYVDGEARVEGNLDLLAQLISILLDNATKYAATFTEVRLTHEKNGVVLSVANDAAHLSDGDKNRCFERFYRDADVAGDVEGSGIGLAIAKQIVTLHKGSISANAKDGVFTVRVVLQAR